MNQWTENYCEEENKLLAYNRFMKDRFKAYVASLYYPRFCEFRF